MSMENNTAKIIALTNAANSALKNGIDAKYSKPSGGIPSTDMSSAVQTSLGKADTALQGADLETVVDAWLDENISNPDSPPLDRTLSSSSSAAPADMVGDIQSAINAIDNSVENLYDETGIEAEYTKQVSSGISFNANNTKFSVHALAKSKIDVLISSTMYTSESITCYYYKVGESTGVKYGTITANTKTTITIPYDIEALAFYRSGTTSAVVNISATVKTVGIAGTVDLIKEETYNIVSCDVGRYKLSSGTPTADSSGKVFGLADIVPCKQSTVYAFSINTTNHSEGSVYINFFDSSKEYMSSSEITISIAYSGIFTTPSGASYLYLSQYRSDGITIDDDSSILITEGAFEKPYVPYISAVDYVARNGDFGNIKLIETSGYFNSNGTIASATGNNEVYTQRIPVDTLGMLAVNLQYGSSQTAWSCYATYDANGAFIERILIFTSSMTNNSKVLYFGSSVKYVSFSYRKYTDGVLTVTGNVSGINALNYLYDTRKVADDANTIGMQGKMLSANGAFPCRFKPCIDHLFVNTRVLVPSESVYHVRLSRKLGFNMIEANIGKTQDNVYITNHFDSGKFGTFFVHKDGTTDISNVAVSSVTWEWVAENVRYNTPINKYQTRPTRLEEFLSECRQQNIIPFIQITESGVLQLAEKYMGKNNFIAYGASRSDCPNAIIYSWQSLSTKESILAYCRSVGVPFIYGLANPTSFTTEQLKDIVQSLHAEGYFIGCSYSDDVWHEYSYLGFDVNGTQTRINRIENGNICNIDSVYGFGGFTYTGATETDGVLVYSSAGTLVPSFDSETVKVGGIDLQIVFDGSITVPSIGTHTSNTYTSTGEIPLFISVPIFNGSNALSISVASGTKIYDAEFKASKF